MLYKVWYGGGGGGLRRKANNSYNVTYNAHEGGATP